MVDDAPDDPMIRGLRIRPEMEGLRASLFDLEADIMEVIWASADVEVSVEAVMQTLQQGRDIAYTTVMTTMARLHDKGLLTRQKDGKRYMYSARLSCSAFQREMTRQVLNSLPPVGRHEAMALLVERLDDGDDAELAELERLLALRRARRSEP